MHTSINFHAENVKSDHVEAHPGSIESGQWVTVQIGRDADFTVFGSVDVLEAVGRKMVEAAKQLRKGDR